jgi:hypothetical protein
MTVVGPAHPGTPGAPGASRHTRATATEVARETATGAATEATSAEDVVTRRATAPLRTIDKVLVALEGFVSLCGLAGGVYLATLETTAMPLHYLDGTWFATWRWPGLALAFFVGVCPGLVALATLRRLGVARLGHLLVGVGLVAWILLEAAWVVLAPGLQIPFGLLGLAILVLGAVAWAEPEPTVASRA